MAIELCYTKFYRLSLFCFFATAAFVSLFVLGLKYTLDRDNPPGNTPYYFPCMVYAVITFVECVVTLAITRQGYKIKQDGRYRTNGSLRVIKLQSVLVICAVLGFTWGIVGSALIGSNGICGNESTKCYYDVNISENRTIAIVSLVLTICVLLFHIIFFSIHGEPPSYTDSSVSKKCSCSCKRILKYLHCKKKKGANRRTAVSPTLDLRPLSDRRQSGSTVKGIAKAHQPLTRQTSVFELKACSLSNDVSETRGDTRIAYHRKQLIRDDNDTDATWKHKDGDQKPPLYEKLTIPRLALINNSISKLNDTNSKTQKGQDIRKNPGDARLPPPSYDKAMEYRVVRKPSDLGPNPYYLPPLPDYDAINYQAPDNIYTGSSFPDTEMIRVPPISANDV